MNRPTLPPVVPTLTLLLAAVALSCGESGTDPVPLASVAVSPGTASLTFLDEATQLSANGRDAGGSTVAITPTWSSSDPSVATVNTAGLVTAVADGSTTVTATATADGTSGSATVTVAQRAATITLDPAADTLDTGTTRGLTADVRDSGGAPLPSPALQWTSSDEAVATVDAQGVVTAVAKGEATISAGRDGASGDAAFTILAADLIVTADTVLTGTVSAGDVEIQAGVTVTVTGSLMLTADGPIQLAGPLVGDCVSLGLTSAAAVTVTGAIDAACTDPPADSAEVPTFEMAGTSIVSDGATVAISGDGIVRLVEPAAAAGPGRASSQAGRTITYRNSRWEHRPSEARAGANGTVSGEDGGRGGLWAFRLTGDEDVMAFENVTLIAQHGGPGGRAEITGPGSEGTVRADGGWGGDGGGIFVDGGTPTFEMTGENVIRAGDGGPGGPAIATAQQSPENPAAAPAALAVSGDGGDGGWSAFPTGTNGNGGRSGNARATGAAGLSADQMGGPAQAGGQAVAFVGTAGRGPVNEATGQRDPNRWGAGGDAFSTGGRGGNGNADFPDGAVGGEMTTGGGETSTERAGLVGTQTTMGGRGGDGADACTPPDESTLVSLIRVFSDPASSDQFLFQAGSSGISIALGLSLSTGAATAGNGGAGGAVSARHQPITWPGISTAPATFVATDAGNGGDGGDGIPPGAGGEAGLASIDGRLTDRTITTSFEEGNPGNLCPPSSPPASPVVTVMLGQQMEGERAITFDSSNPNWVEVTGTLAQDNTFTAEGRGMVAGTPNVLVQFAGSFDPEARTLSADYTMDPERIIDANHPIVYRVEAGN